MMKRREFITLLGGATAWPLAARHPLACRAIVRWLAQGTKRGISRHSVARSGTRSIVLTSYGKTPAARLGRRPERRHRTGSPRRLLRVRPAGGAPCFLFTRKTSFHSKKL